MVSFVLLLIYSDKIINLLIVKSFSFYALVTYLLIEFVNGCLIHCFEGS